jgi:hypothetical protein
VATFRQSGKPRDGLPELARRETPERRANNYNLNASRSFFQLLLARPKPAIQSHFEKTPDPKTIPALKICVKSA